MKKLLSFVLALVCLFSFAGCTEKSTGKEVTKDLGVENYSKYLNIEFDISPITDKKVTDEETGNLLAIATASFKITVTPKDEKYKFENAKIGLNLTYGYSNDSYVIDIDENGNGYLEKTNEYTTDITKNGGYNLYPFEEKNFKVASVEGSVKYIYEMPKGN